MRKVALIALAGALVLVAGCGEGDSAETTTTAAPTDGPLVTYSREGGVASMPVELTIETDGSATLTSEYDGQAEDFTLDGAELDRLTGELEAADLDGFGGPAEPSSCADCFLYTVTYGETTVSYDDTASPSDEIVALVGHLDELAMAHTPAPAG
jgi:hypothetical protein